MNYNLYFVFSAIMLYAGMIFTVSYRKTVKQATGKIFLAMLIIGFIGAVAEYLSVTKSIGTIAVYISNCVLISSEAVLGFCYATYIIGLTDNWHKFEHKFIYKGLLCIPFLIVFGFVFSNYWTNWVFIVENGVYRRGFIIEYGLIYSTTLIYFVISLIYIFKYRKFFTKIQLATLISICPLCVIASLIQIFLPEILLVVFFIAISCMLMMNIVERHEEFYDQDICLLKYQAYYQDSYKATVTKEEAYLFFIKIANNQTINLKFDYEKLIDIRKTIGNIMKETLKDFSCKGRFYWLGLGQFATVARNMGHDTAEAIAMTMRRRLNVPVKTSFGIIDIYSNVALVKFPDDIQNEDMAMSFVDNFYHIDGVLDNVLDLSNIPNRKEFEMKMSMASIIKRGLVRDSFEVYFQPIYSIKEKAFVSAEALLRLKDEKFGIISPALFLPEAERNGSIHKIGDIVFDQVCKFIASEEFKEVGLEYIEVNLSVVQFMHEDLPIHIMDAVKRYGVEPRRINIDIIESVDTYSHKMMEDNIKILRELGFTFSLDDYGTGYSKMDTVSSIPFDTIKINQNLATSNNPEMKVMMEHSIKMIKDMKRKIVVEGIETEEMLNSFEGYLCDYIQGYYFSKPLPEKDFIKFLRKNHNAERNIEFEALMEPTIEEETVEETPKDVEDIINLDEEVSETKEQVVESNEVTEEPTVKETPVEEPTVEETAVSETTIEETPVEAEEIVEEETEEASVEETPEEEKEEPEEEVEEAVEPEVLAEEETEEAPVEAEEVEVEEEATEEEVEETEPEVDETVEETPVETEEVVEDITEEVIDPEITETFEVKPEESIDEALEDDVKSEDVKLDDSIEDIESIEELSLVDGIDESISEKKVEDLDETTLEKITLDTLEESVDKVDNMVLATEKDESLEDDPFKVTDEDDIDIPVIDDEITENNLE